jgi:choline dehydrogenase
MVVAPAPTPHPLVAALLDGARSVGIPTFESPNGRMMEGQGGAASRDMIVRDGKRQSVYRSYVAPVLGNQT